MYLTQLKDKDSQDLDELREQLGEIGTTSGRGPPDARARAQPGFVLRIRRMGLRGRRTTGATGAACAKSR